MIPAEMVMGFLRSSKDNGKRVKITSSEHGVKKGCIRDVKMENKVITIEIEDTIMVMDMNVMEAKTSFFDRRVLHVIGEEQYKIQLN